MAVFDGVLWGCSAAFRILYNHPTMSIYLNQILNQAANPDDRGLCVIRVQLDWKSLT